MSHWLRRIYGLFAAADPFIAALGGVLFLYYALVPGIFEGKASGDGLFGFMYLPGLFFHGSLDLRYTLPDRIPYLGIEATGHVANLCPIGPAFVWTPTYLLGLLLQKLHLLPASSRFGHGRADFWFAGLGTLLFGQLGIAATFRLLRRYLTVAAARFGTVVGVLATPICFYFVTQPMYQHGCAFAAVALFLERWDRISDEDGWRDWALLGLLAGIAMLMRLQEGMVLGLPALTLLGRLRRDPAGSLGRGVLLLVTAALAFVPQLLVWRYFYGQLRPPQPPGHMRWGEPALVEALFSLRAGLFPWVPALYLALPGLLAPALRTRRRGLLLGLLFLLGLWVNAAAWDYHGSWAFGPRRFTDVTTVFAAGLGGIYAWLAGRRGTRRILVGAAVALVAYNLLLMELVRTRRIKSASSGAFPATEWVRWAGGPAWLGQALGRVGYPFMQPAGWLYSLLYRVPASAPEGILGSYVLERDWRVRSLFIGPTALPLHGPSPYRFADAAPPGQQRLRLIVPLYTREGLRLRLQLVAGAAIPTDPEAGLSLRWNDVEVPLRFQPTSRLYAAEVPKELVHARARWNEVTITAPASLPLDRLEFLSYEPWWQAQR